MGYRSDVKYVLLFKTQDHRNAFHMEAKLIASDVEYGLEVVNDDFDFHYDEHDEEYPYQIRVHFNDVKWYESTPWVDMQDKLMKLACDGYGGAFVFMRLGEQDDDVEVKNECAEEDGYVDGSNYIEFTRRSNFI